MNLMSIIFPNGINEKLAIPDNKWGAQNAQIIIGKDWKIELEYYYYELSDGNISISGIKNIIKRRSAYYFPYGFSSDIIIPETIDNKPVVSLTEDDGFFRSNQSIITVSIPYSVKEISDNFFSGAAYLKTISFPEGKNPDLEIPDDKWGADADVQILGKNGEVLR